MCTCVAAVVVAAGAIHISLRLILRVRLYYSSQPKLLKTATTLFSTTFFCFLFLHNSLCVVCVFLFTLPPLHPYNSKFRWHVAKDHVTISLDFLAGTFEMQLTYLGFDGVEKYQRWQVSTGREMMSTLVETFQNKKIKLLRIESTTSKFKKKNGQKKKESKQMNCQTDDESDGWMDARVRLARQCGYDWRAPLRCCQ